VEETCRLACPLNVIRPASARLRCERNLELSQAEPLVERNTDIAISLRDWGLLNLLASIIDVVLMRIALVGRHILDGRRRDDLTGRRRRRLASRRHLSVSQRAHAPVRHAITTGMTLAVAPFSASQNWSSFTTSMLSS
jgi:hypothetical protein